MDLWREQTCMFAGIVQGRMPTILDVFMLAIVT